MRWKSTLILNFNFHFNGNNSSYINTRDNSSYNWNTLCFYKKVPFANHHIMNSSFYFGLKSCFWILIRFLLLITFGTVKKWILRFFTWELNLPATFKNDIHAFKGNGSFLFKKAKKKKKLKIYGICITRTCCIPYSSC